MVIKHINFVLNISQYDVYCKNTKKRLLYVVIPIVHQLYQQNLHFFIVLKLC
jgi:hypothetical protein